MSRREIGRLSVSESGLGMGILWICFARCGRILWMRVCSMILWAIWAQARGSLARTLIVKPSQRALCGHFCMSCRKFSLVLKASFVRSYLNGHVRSECGSGGVNMGARLL